MEIQAGLVDESGVLPSRPRGSRGLEVSLLVAVLLFALFVRLGHTNRGLPYLHHVDEPHTSAVALTVMTTGDWNPHRFHYGSLNIYAAVAVDAAHYLWLARSPDPITGKPIQLEDIQPMTQDGWRLEISHPSFYHWNRATCGVLGALTVLAVFLIGRRFNPRVGLLAAGLLATTPIHILNSAVVAPDVPVGFLVTLCVLLSSAYFVEGKTRALVLAFVVAGLAIGTKYNSALVVAVPYLALALRKDLTRPKPTWLWWAGLPIAIGTFFCVVPYAVLDLPLFLKHAGSQVAHYSVAGHGPATIEAGWPHVVRQMERFGSTLSWPVVALALLGLLTSLRTRLGWIIFGFSIIYFFMQTRMVVSFHRNFLCLYPFIALGAGLGLSRILGWIGESRPRLRRGILAFATLGLATTMAWQASESAAVANHRETRSVAADRIAELALERGWKSVGVAHYLRMHALDLIRIDADVETDPLPVLRRHESRYDAIICPVSYEIPGRGEDGEQNQNERSRRLNSYIPLGEPVLRIDGAAMDLGLPTEDPAVLVFEAPFEFGPHLDR